MPAQKAVAEGARASGYEPYAKERLIASDLLRFVLNLLLTHPEYQEPVKIYEGLLLKGDDVPKPAICGDRRKRAGKA